MKKQTKQPIKSRFFNFLRRPLIISVSLNFLLSAVIYFAFSAPEQPEPAKGFTFIGDSNGTGGLAELVGKAAKIAIKNESVGSNSFPKELTKNRPAGPKIVMLGTNFCKDTTAAILYIRTNPDAIYITNPNTKLNDSAISEIIKTEAKRVGAQCIDLHRFTDEWAKDKSMLSDGIHFTAAGRNKAALFISENLKTPD